MATKTFTFASLPHNIAELKALPEASLNDAYATAALTVLALCEYRENSENCVEMLNYLKGPQPLSPFEKQFLRDRLAYGAGYIPFSFFEGAVPGNNYTPASPFTVRVSDNPYSFQTENYAVLWLTSGGADSPREVKLRKKPSTGEWFLSEQMLLGGIRTPVADDPWA